MSAPRIPKTSTCECGEVRPCVWRSDCAPEAEPHEGKVWIEAHTTSPSDLTPEGAHCAGRMVRTIRAGLLVRGDRVLLGTRGDRGRQEVVSAKGGYRDVDRGQPDTARQRRDVLTRSVSTIDHAPRQAHLSERSFRLPFGEHVEVIRLVTDD